MSLIVLKTYDDNPIDNGKLIVFVEDTGIWKAREFDTNLHTLADVVGVSYTKTNSGRISANPDGLYYNASDYYLYNEDLSPDYNSSNPNYDPSFNPVNDDSYIYLAHCGMVAVDVAYTSLPSNWKKIKSGTSYNLYII